MILFTMKDVCFGRVHGMSTRYQRYTKEYNYTENKSGMKQMLVTEQLCSLGTFYDILVSPLTCHLWRQA